MYRLSGNLVASTFCNPQGLSTPVMGLLYLSACVIFVFHIKGRLRVFQKRALRKISGYRMQQKKTAE